MFKTKTGELRSPRKIAEQHGAAPAGFADWGYDSAAGIPDRAMGAGQKYDDKVAQSPTSVPAAAQRKPY